MTRAYLGIGSNLGDRVANLQLAVDALASASGIAIVAVSPVYETEPVGGPPQDDFLNAVAAVETDLGPRELLAVCAAIEQDAHRVREVRWGPRTLDVDILLVEGVQVDEPDLQVPHPRMRDRAFVLAPLHDVAPDLVERPSTGWAGIRQSSVALRAP